MNDNNNSVIFLKDWKILIQSLSKDDQLDFWDLFMQYDLNSNIECNNKTILPIWNFVKSQLDNMRSKYVKKKESITERNRENGLKGGRPKTKENPPVIEPQKIDNSILISELNNEIKDELMDSEIFKKCNEFFSLNSETQKMQLFGDLKRLERSNSLPEFTSQTIAYIDYKTLSNEKTHYWQSYLTEWQKINWIDKLSKWKDKKPNNSTNGKQESDPNNIRVGRSNISELEKLHQQMAR